MKTHYAWLAGTAVIVLVAVATALRSGERDSPNDQDRIPAAARQEIKSVEREIDRIEAESLKQSRSVTLDRFQEITLLGKLIFYDKELSVKRNETCAFCHMPETGFSGPVSALNQTTVAYPGSVRTRLRPRKRPDTGCSGAKPRTATNATETEDRVRSRCSPTLPPPTWAYPQTRTSLSIKRTPLTNSGTRPTPRGSNTLIQEWVASCPAR